MIRYYSFSFLEKGESIMELSEKAKEVRRKYHRKYYQENKERVRMRINEYWERKADELMREGKHESQSKN